MLMLVSPAKSLDYDKPASTKKFTQPQLIDESKQLIKGLKQLNPDDIGKLMSISEKLSELNFERFQQWQPDFDLENAKQAVFAFQGDVYQGLDIEQFDSKALNFAQKHLLILSGLYGLLRPLDLMQPYRLEMGTRYENERGKDLYAFWGEQITDCINAQLKKNKSDCVLNLASNEYFKSVKPKLLDQPVITPVFKDYKNGQYKIISFYAKKARGLMAAYVIDKQITDVKKIKRFKVDGYYYSAEESTKDKWVFLRDEQK